MKIMNAKFSGKCATCDKRITKGEVIAYDRENKAAHHEACTREEGEEAREPSEWEATLANDRRMAKRGLTVVRFSSGAVYTQNSRGRCEDAPCCGCCG